LQEQMDAFQAHLDADWSSQPAASNALRVGVPLPSEQLGNSRVVSGGHMQTHPALPTPAAGVPALSNFQAKLQAKRQMYQSVAQAGQAVHVQGLEWSAEVAGPDTTTSVSYNNAMGPSDPGVHSNVSVCSEGPATSVACAGNLVGPSDPGVHSNVSVCREGPAPSVACAGNPMGPSDPGVHSNVSVCREGPGPSVARAGNPAYHMNTGTPTSVSYASPSCPPGDRQIITQASSPTVSVSYAPRSFITRMIGGAPAVSARS
jgi:hypothetical protein